MSGPCEKKRTSRQRRVEKVLSYAAEKLFYHDDGEKRTDYGYPVRYGGGEVETEQQAGHYGREIADRAGAVQYQAHEVFK